MIDPNVITGFLMDCKNFSYLQQVKVMIEKRLVELSRIGLGPKLTELATPGLPVKKAPKPGRKG